MAQGSIGKIIDGEYVPFATNGGGSVASHDATKVDKTDISSIILAGSINNTGETITAGTWFYLNGTPCVAKVDIASGATFTDGTNYEEKTIGSALSELNGKIDDGAFNPLSINDHVDNIDNITATSGWSWINGTPGTYPGGTSYIPGWFIVFTMPIFGGSYCVQFLAHYTSEHLYMRTKVNGTLGAWVTIK